MSRGVGCHNSAYMASILTLHHTQAYNPKEQPMLHMCRLPIER